MGAQLWEPHSQIPTWKAPTGFTTPDAQTLQSLLSQAQRENVQVVVMEVTSHAIALERIAGTEFDVAAFLNFSQDHLDFHKTLEEYKAVKKSFFNSFLLRQKNLCWVVVNENDSVGRELIAELPETSIRIKRNSDYTVD